MSSYHFIRDRMWNLFPRNSWHEEGIHCFSSSEKAFVFRPGKLSHFKKVWMEKVWILVWQVFIWFIFSFWSSRYYKDKICKIRRSPEYNTLWRLAGPTLVVVRKRSKAWQWCSIESKELLARRSFVPCSLSWRWQSFIKVEISMRHAVLLEEGQVV